jgi:hypothetical protein
MYVCTFNVTFQVPVTFQIYLVFKNTWEDWGNYFAFQEKIVEFPIHFYLVYFFPTGTTSLKKVKKRWLYS